MFHKNRDVIGALILTMGLGKMAPVPIFCEEHRPLAGTVVRSDEWKVRRSPPEEEFIGHVSYRDGRNRMTCDRAVFRRGERMWKAQGRVHLTRTLEAGHEASVWGDAGSYDMDRQSGEVLSLSARHPVRFRWNAEDGVAEGQSLRATLRGPREGVLSGQRPWVLFTRTQATAPEPNDIRSAAAQADHIQIWEEPSRRPILRASGRVQGWAVHGAQGRRDR